MPVPRCRGNSKGKQGDGRTDGRRSYGDRRNRMGKEGSVRVARPPLRSASLPSVSLSRTWDGAVGRGRSNN